MLGASRPVAATAVLSAALLLAACSSGGHTPAKPGHLADVARPPLQILQAPQSLLSATVPQASGIAWGLAGSSSKGLYQLGAVTSAPGAASVSVSSVARSLTESSKGVLGLALGSRRSGALELLNGHTAKPIKIIALPAPARQVVAGKDGTTFYVLTAWAKSASVSVVNSRNDKLRGSIPVPLDAVSVVPNPAQTALYVLQANGLVDVISLAGGKISSSFQVGDPGISLALSPDGSTLYVLKGSGSVSNIAVVDTATQSVHRVLPAPSNCREVLVSASGNQLYEVVGTARYGNIQVFAS
jgi:DNA-binding beta-propeller fold protein YncE